MSTLNKLDLMEWLTLPEAAQYLQTTFGDISGESDVLRLVRGGKLQLSIRFVNLVKVRLITQFGMSMVFVIYR